jgi:hypothetical protein
MSYPCRKQREKTISGYLDDPELLATCAAELNASGKYSGIYMTLNPSNSALLARCCNRVEAIPKETTSRPGYDSPSLAPHRLRPEEGANWQRQSWPPG